MSNAKTQYRPPCGHHIDAACKEAVEFASRTGRVQRFTFNDVEVVATAGSDPAALSAKFHADQEAAYKAYQDSPDGKRAAEERQADIRRKQTKHDELARTLVDSLSQNRDALMRWLAEYTNVADDIGVKKDFATIIAALEEAGYSSNEATGLPKSEYGKPAIMCAYIVGQAIACMKKGMPPHPMLGSFVERYFKLKPEATP